MGISDNQRNKLRKKAEAIFREQGDIAPELLNKNIDALLEEISIYQIELEEQNKELQAAQLNTLIQKNKFIDLFDNAPIAYAILDQHKRFINANKNALFLLDTDLNHLKTQNFTNFVHPDDQDQIYFFFKSLQKSNDEKNTTIRIINRQKEIVTAQILVKPDFKDGLTYRISITDITEQTQLAHEARFKGEIISGINDCVIAFANGQINFWNNGAERLMGYRSDFATGKNPAFIFEEFDAEFFERIQPQAQLLDKKHYWNARTATSECITVEVSFSKLETSPTNETTFILFCRDVTMQQQANAILNRTRAQIDNILNSIDDYIYISNPETFEVLFANRPMLEKFPNIAKEPCYKAIYGSNNKCSFCKIDQLINNKTNTGNTQEVYNESDHCWYNVSEKKIDWDAHQTAVVHKLNNITELKTAEQARLENAEMFAKLAIAANDAIVMINDQGLIRFWNPHAEKLFGYTEQEAIGQNLHKLLTQEPMTNQALNGLNKFAESGHGKVIDKTYEMPARRKDGTVFIAELSVASVKVKDHWHAIGIIKDITQRKEKEKQLAESEERLKTIVNNIKDAIFIHKLNGDFIDSNEAFSRLTGYTSEELKTLNASILISKKGQSFYAENLKKILNGEEFIGEEEIITKSGTIVPVEINASLINYKDQKAILVSGRNLTDRIHDRQQLLESENRFKTMADNIPDAIYLHKLDGQFIDTNRKAIEMLGYSHAEFMKMKPTDISGTYRKPEDFGNIMTILMSKQQTTFEDTHITKDGRTIPVTIIATIIDYRGTKSVFAVAHDITNRKKVEREQIKLISQLNHLSHSATKLISLEQIIDILKFTGNSINTVLSDAIIVVHEFQGNQLHIVNFFDDKAIALDAFKQITAKNPLDKGYNLTEEKINLYKTGKLEKAPSLADLLAPYYDKQYIERLTKKLEIVETYTIGIASQNKLYATINLILRAPLSYSEKEYIQALVHQASIAIQRKMDMNALVEAKNNAEEANRARNTFLTNISHEIRTPMNTILGFTEILAKDSDNAKTRSYLQAISSGSRKLLELINDILDLSKLDAGNMPILPIPTSIETLLSDMAWQLKMGAKQKGLEFTIDVEPDVPQIVKIDQTRLRQVLHNLISNAIKFTKQGLVSVEIRTHNKTRRTTNLIIKVNDTGIGIEQSEIEKITDSFMQADNRDARKYDGTGMGLTIAKKITELMNGTLTIESFPGKGSSFIIQLNKVEIIENIAPGTLSTNIANTTFKKEKILLVEEDANQAQHLENLMRQHNLVIITAESGDQAFAFAHEFMPDLIIINLTTQSNKSIGTAEAIKSSELTQHIIILAITHQNTNDFANAQKAKYFTDILNPPITKPQLINKIAQYINCEQPEIIEPGEFNDRYGIRNIATKNLTSMVDELQKTATPLCNTLAKRQPLSKVREFAQIIEAIANKHNAEPLIEYHKDLKTSIDAFDITEMRKLLEEYNHIIQTLTELIEK